MSEYSLFISCLLFLVSSCSNYRGQDKNVISQNDPFVKSIPTDNKGNPIKAYEFKTALSEKLKLNSIESGFDSIKLRIWFSPLNTDSIYMLELHNANKSKCFARVWKYKLKFSDNRQFIDSAYGEIYQTSPKSGWNFLLSRLFELGVTTMPDGDKLKRITTTGSAGIAVEVSTKTSYRFYHYLDPDIYDESITEARNMKLILQLLEQQIDLAWGF